MTHYDIITIGTATRDVFLRTKEMKRLTDPKHLKAIGFLTGEAECFALGAKLEVETFLATVGGGAVNTAVTFARQGFRTGAIIKVGDDAGGREVVSRLKDEGVHALPAMDKRSATGYSTILLTERGERTILVHRGASEELTARDLKLSTFSARWAYLAPSKIPFNVMYDAVAALKRRGTKIALNPSRFYLDMGAQKLRPLLNKCDVVTMNQEEASYLTGVAYDKEHAIFRKLDKLVEGVVAMTRGRDGAVLSDGSYLYRAGIYPDSGAVDRTGAGDAFGAGLVAGLMEKNDLAHALKLASANAASVVESIGATESALPQGALRRQRFRYLDLDIEPLV